MHYIMLVCFDFRFFPTLMASTMLQELLQRQMWRTILWKLVFRTSC